MIIYPLGGVFLFFRMLHTLRTFAEANRAALALVIRRDDGGAALLAGLLRGRFDMAIGLGGLGAWLLGIAQWIAFADVHITGQPSDAESFLRKVGDEGRSAR
jgi:hypothetical protein